MLEILLKTECLSKEQLSEIFRLYCKSYGLGYPGRGEIYLENHQKDIGREILEYHQIPKAKFVLKPKKRKPEGKVLSLIALSQSHPEPESDKIFYHELSVLLSRYKIQMINPDPKRQNLR